jgi:cytochrome c biogenesis protein CcmG/thiol:disulfide interchange protein DsbE
MPSRRTYIFFSLAILLLSAGWIAFSRSSPGSAVNQEIPIARPGFLAPDFTLTTLEGESIRLADLRGRAVIINLWASWCPPCRAEMPALQRVSQDFPPNDMQILAVNLTSQDSREEAAQFAQENSLTFPILLDETGEVGALYQTSALPTTFFISADGTIREMIVGGPISEALLRAQVNQLMGEVR